jgi:hypothetical protein
MYSFVAESSLIENTKGAMLFGTMWGLNKVFSCPWIRKKIKKEIYESEISLF